ncbi:autotransporter outer membrane beta-barrel domain-containing protein [Escherichia coli O121]|nr:autotransporter outer membrane beta-barrel domain-containing protein [Escherichia coli]WNT57107.1 autotransporter outer membrane beta-barrel domain-containing protein [Escherichia coli O121]
MTFNATLGGDNSPTDKMNVKGDTQGNTRVRVDNIGGVGAQTVNGIELIEVGGNSAGNFALTTGTVEAGAYVYTLAKGKGNDEKNWYLTSKWDGVTPADTPDPINNPPVVDPEGPSVYRPEAGSYISNIAAANSLFSIVSGIVAVNGQYIPRFPPFAIHLNRAAILQVAADSGFSDTQCPPRHNVHITCSGDISRHHTAVMDINVLTCHINGRVGTESNFPPPRYPSYPDTPRNRC